MGDDLMKFDDSLRHILIRTKLYTESLLKWAAVSFAIGAASGAVGSVFHHCVDTATYLRGAYPWLLWCLPLAGLVIVGLYQLLNTQGMGTDAVLDAVLDGRRLKWQLAPSIFLGTVLTHLCGGAAGREGAALQLGGTIGQGTGRLLRLNEEDLQIATLAGMSACFSALFGTPLTAALFAVLCVSVGELYHLAMLPCLISALTAFWTSQALEVSPTHFTVQVPELTVGVFLRTAVLAALCGLLSIFFCRLIHGTGHLLAKYLPNPYLRAAAGGGAIIALTLLLGTRTYNGAGMDVIAASLESGTAPPWAFFWKLLFTAITLGAGYKGGEVVPSFFVGAAFGCAAGPLLGLPAGFAAALGLTAVFCGATNCLLASIALSVELFGSDGLLCFALACAVSFTLSGYSGLYDSQRIVFSKLHPRRLEVRANAHGAEEEQEDPQHI